MKAFERLEYFVSRPSLTKRFCSGNVAVCCETTECYQFADHPQLAVRELSHDDRVKLQKAAYGKLYGVDPHSHLVQQPCI